MRTVIAALTAVLTLVGCSSKATGPQPPTPATLSALTGDGYIRFAATVTGPATPYATGGCYVIQHGDVTFDASARVMLAAENLPGASSSLEDEAAPVLGYGRPQRNGTCEFRVVLEFPVPSSQPRKYMFSISGGGRGGTNQWSFTADQVMTGQRFHIAISGDWSIDNGRCQQDPLHIAAVQSLLAQSLLDTRHDFPATCQCAHAQ